MLGGFGREGEGGVEGRRGRGRVACKILEGVNGGQRSLACGGRPCCLFRILKGLTSAGLMPHNAQVLREQASVLMPHQNGVLVR